MFICLSLATFVALADDNDDFPMTKEERQQAREERAAQREEARAARKAAREEAMEQRMLERCERLVARVAARIEKMEDNREVHISNFERIIERFNEMIVALTEEGLDTSALEEDLATFEGMVETYHDIYSDFVASLEGYEGDVCEDMEGGRKGVLQAAKDHLRILTEKRQELRQFFAHELRADIKQLREQANAMHMAGQEDVEEEEEVENEEEEVEGEEEEVENE